MIHCHHSGDMVSVMETKICKSCGVEKSLDDYYQTKTGRGGYNARCKDCVRSQVRGYLAVNREVVAARKREAYHRDIEASRARERRRNQQRREQKISYMRDWYRRNRVAVLAQKRAIYDPTQAKAKYAANREQRRVQFRAWYVRNRDRDLRKGMEWARANPEKRIALYHRRRARLLAAFVEDVDLKDIYRRDRGICQLCGGRVSWRSASIDHILPLAAGGKHERVNAQLAHRSCNSRKWMRPMGQMRMLP